MRRFASRDGYGRDTANVGELNNGLSFVELAGTIYNAYRNAASGAKINLPPWQDAGEGTQEAFARVVKELEPVIAEADGISWMSLARLARLAFDGKPLEDTDDADKLCWVAVVRHLTNMLDWAQDDEEPVEKHELYWCDWVAKQLAIHQGQGQS